MDCAAVRRRLRGCRFTAPGGDFDSHSDYGGSGGGGSDDDSGDGAAFYIVVRIITFFGELVGIKSPVLFFLLALVIFLALKFGLAALRGKTEKAPELQRPISVSGKTCGKLKVQ